MMVRVVVLLMVLLMMMQYGGLLCLCVARCGISAEFDAWFDVARCREPRWP